MPALVMLWTLPSNLLHWALTGLHAPSVGIVPTGFFKAWLRCSMGATDEMNWACPFRRGYARCLMPGTSDP